MARWARALFTPSARTAGIAATLAAATLVTPYGIQLGSLSSRRPARLGGRDGVDARVGDCGRRRCARGVAGPGSRMGVAPHEPRPAGGGMDRRHVCRRGQLATAHRVCGDHRCAAHGASLASGASPRAHRVDTGTPPRRRRDHRRGDCCRGLFVRPKLACFPPIAGWRAPESDAVQFVRDSHASRVVVHFDYGEYAIFHLRGMARVSMDNRRETVYSDAAVRASDRFAAGDDPGYPDRIGADAVWWPTADVRVIRALESLGWVTRFEGSRTVVLLRSAGTVVGGVAREGTPCFPNP